MKTATLRDLRNNFAKLEAWLAEGEEIEILRKGHPVAVLSAAKDASAPQWPDFAARLQKIWGDRVFSDEEVAAMRAYELEGEEG
jgi:antitoxin (DNA-binding transcriptional repressor) of toxin-antitoxin stability system